jgi:hypothetical protein
LFHDRLLASSHAVSSDIYDPDRRGDDGFDGFPLDDPRRRVAFAAVRRQTTVSAIAGDVLERNRPRLGIERDA